jgi:hypothetical protein
MKNKPERRGKITRRKFVNIAASGSMGLAALPLAGFIPGLSLHGLPMHHSSGST